MTETEIDSRLHSIRRGHVWILFFILATGWLPALLWPDTIQKSASYYDLLKSGNPYFVPEHFFLFYLLTPLVVFSSCLILLSPGLILSLALDRGKNFYLWMISSLALSILIVSLAAAVVQSLIPAPVTGNGFIMSILICSLVCFGVLLSRIQKGMELRWPMSHEGSKQTLFITMGIPLVVLLGMFPKFFWENFNGDGVQAFECGRLLLVQPLPFWERSAGDVANYPGITSMLSCFLVSWFIRIFGEFEVCARLPFVLSIGFLFVVISAMIYQDRNRLPARIEQYCIAMGVLLFVVVSGFNASYNPYMSDIAAPTARDTLVITCLIGFLVYFLRKEYFWMFLFLILGFCALPTVQMLVGLWLCSVFLVFRPRPWKPILIASGFFVGCLAVNAILPHMLAAFGFPLPGGEFSVRGILYRLELRSPEWNRFLFLVVPSGILPVWALFSWHKQDQVSRALTIVTAAYFAFFFIQKHTALHHFIPVMIFPIIVFWRTDWWRHTSYGRLIPYAAVSCVLIALLLSLPPHFKPDFSGRMVGSEVEDRTGGYEDLDSTAFGRAHILERLFPGVWSGLVPTRSYGGAWITWYFYAHHPEPTLAEKNYILQLPHLSAPAGTTLISKNPRAALYVRNMNLRKKHAALRPPTPAFSRLYRFSPSTLFPGLQDDYKTRSPR